MQPEGNVDEDPHHEFTGKNILFAAKPVEGLEESEQIMLAARGKRPRPHLDDKILAGWNGMMISAFAKAGAVLGHAAYIAAARRAAEFLDSTMVQRNGVQPDGKLLRRYREGQAAIPGMLEDYAAFAGALLDLYEVTGEYYWLARAIALTDWQIVLFEDVEGGGFFASSMEDASKLIRVKDDYDGAEPSGNSVALGNLLRLYRMTGNSRYDESARKLIAALQPQLAAAPYALPQMLAACEMELAPHRQVAIAGQPTEEISRALWPVFDPNRVVLHADARSASLQPALAGMTAPEGGCAVYVCENFTCQSPVTRGEDLARLLK
jgi:hypothetical protein